MVYHRLAPRPALSSAALALVCDPALWETMDYETQLGGRAREFPQTTWRMVAGLQDAGGAHRQHGLEALCRRYWKPIYAYVRARWRKSNEEAKDVTQAFFAWLVEGEVLRRYAPEKGTFRHYLKGLLRNYVSNYDQARRRLKRGGGAAPRALDDDLVGLADLLPDPKAETPEEAFDRAWTDQVIQEALARTRARCEAEGKPLRFAAFEAYELASPGERPTYAEVAERLGVKEGDVRNYLYAVRERLRAELRRGLLDTVSDPDQLRAEWGALFEAG